MIFGTVGMHDHGFEGLVRALDSWAKDHSERVVIQRGPSRYVPVHAEHFHSADEARIRRFMVAARVVVTHAGVGSVLTSLDVHRPLIVVPRSRRHPVIHDDHQVSFARMLRRELGLLVIEDLDELARALEMVTPTIPVWRTDRGQLRRYLEERLDRVATKCE